MRKLFERPRAVAGLPVRRIDEDSRLFEDDNGYFQLHLVEAENEGRAEAQRFISEAYHRVFDAELRDFYPSIITLCAAGKGLKGAVGARYADGQSVFLEQYLEQSVEQLIQARTSAAVARSRIVEIGNLSVIRPALTYPFISMIGNWLQGYGVDWIVSSLTATLRSLLTRTGVTLVDLGAARAQMLVKQTSNWGRYYEHGPRVTAVNLADGLSRFQSHHHLLPLASGGSVGTARGMRA